MCDIIEKLCMLFMSKEQKIIHEWAKDNIETPSIYELVKLLPNRKGVIGQRYSNYGMGKKETHHYPLFHRGNDALEFANWDTCSIPSAIVENNPEYFKLIKQGYAHRT